MNSPNPARLPAVGQLFERYGPMVHRRCRAILGAEEAALDAVQDVFLRVVEKGHLFRGDSAPSTWLYATATLLCLQRLRNRASHEGKLRLFAAASGAAYVNGPDDRLLVMRLLDHQPEEVRLMVYLRCVDEMTMDEVAEIVGYSRKTVSQKVSDFLTAARAQLQMSEATP
jgi:RNA polymerase sigma-70 factor (ECF subfamily)